MLFLGGLALWKQLLKANDLKLVECFASEQKNIVETAKRDKYQVPKQTIRLCNYAHFIWRSTLSKISKKIFALKIRETHYV